MKQHLGAAAALDFGTGASGFCSRSPRRCPGAFHLLKTSDVGLTNSPHSGLWWPSPAQPLGQRPGRAPGARRCCTGALAAAGGLRPGGLQFAGEALSHTSYRRFWEEERPAAGTQLLLIMAPLPRTTARKIPEISRD